MLCVPLFVFTSGSSALSGVYRSDCRHLSYSIHFSEFMPGFFFTRKRTKHENTRNPPFSFIWKRKWIWKWPLTVTRCAKHLNIHWFQWTEKGWYWFTEQFPVLQIVCRNSCIPGSREHLAVWKLILIGSTDRMWNFVEGRREVFFRYQKSYTFLHVRCYNISYHMVAI